MLDSPAGRRASEWTDMWKGRTVAVVGLGYVGLPTALALAEADCRVLGHDISELRLAAVEAGVVDLVPADHKRLAKHVNTPALTLTSDPAVIGRADAMIVCVPTPVDAHLVPDMTALAAACRSVVSCARRGQAIVLTSTTYVGCTRDLLIRPLREVGLEPGRDLCVAFSPERIDPGNELHSQDIVPRVVGGTTPECARAVADLLGLVTSSVHVVSSPEAAEATKLLENSFRAVNIALANEFADACGEFGLDIVEVIEAAATKPYGFMPFYPGPGVGGHCIPCDPHYLLWQMKARRTQLPLMETAMSSIAVRPRQVVAKACEALAGRGRALAGARVLVVGVAYKPGVRDLRGSPALEILAELIARGAHVAYVDPLVDVLHVEGRRLTGVADPARLEWDLVLVHTLHPDVDLGWLDHCGLVLDATYRARNVAGSVRL